MATVCSNILKVWLKQIYCSLVSLYWQSILNYIEDVLGNEIPDIPAVVQKGPLHGSAREEHMVMVTYMLVVPYICSNRQLALLAITEHQ